MTAKMLNLGSGRTKFPGPRPDHHGLVDPGIYAYPYWLNVSKNASEEPDCVMDLFAYPWSLESDAYEGALLSHLVEHIPHEIKLSRQQSSDSQGELFNEDGVVNLDVLKANVKANVSVTKFLDMQDGWFAFWSELYRVLRPGAMVYVLAPYATSHGFLGDPTHTRPIVEQVFYHSMTPNPDAPFEYSTGGLHFEVRDMHYTLMPAYAHLLPMPEDPPNVIEAKATQRDYVIHSQWNVISDIYVKLECIK